MPMIMRFWDAEMAYFYKEWGKGFVFDGSRATKILGIEYIRDMRLVDMGVSMIAGCIEDKSIPW